MSDQWGSIGGPWVVSPSEKEGELGEGIGLLA